MSCRRRALLRRYALANAESADVHDHTAATADEMFALLDRELGHVPGTSG
jgi:hypothetical protein